MSLKKNNCHKRKFLKIFKYWPILYEFITNICVIIGKYIFFNSNGHFAILFFALMLHILNFKYIQNILFPFMTT